MDIILLQDVKGLGDQFDTVSVKPGYGRNYLIPQKMAILATPANKATVGERRKQIVAKEAKNIHQIEALIERVKSKTVTVGAKVGGSDKIFGSITNIQLADAINAQLGVEVDRRRVTILDDVKVLGLHKARVRFAENMHADIEFEVIAE